MATKFSFEIALIVMLLFSIAVANDDDHRSFDDENLSLSAKIFDVTKYGAVANGKTENSKAFLSAWKDACNYSGGSGVLIPKGTFYLETVRFVGPCKGPIAFLLKGNLTSPTNPAKFNDTDTWIGFQYVGHLIVKGGGYLDGQGLAAWKYNDCKKNPKCVALPATIRFNFIRKSMVNKITSINSKNVHVAIFGCYKLEFSNISLIAPADSPNTDGIRIGTSRSIKISHSLISTGDDCVAMLAGSEDIDIFDVTCGPGHGISIGSLGRSRTDERVFGIRVRNSTIFNTENGARIKTWATGTKPSLASNITFENVVMNNVSNPVFIDQQYCPVTQCTAGESRVQIQDVVFKNITGTSNTQESVKLICSKVYPCKNVTLIDINLPYMGPKGPATATCSNVLGSSYGKQIPKSCI